MKPVEEILITGDGVVSPLGSGTRSFRENLLAGNSGIDWRPGWEGDRSPVAIAGQVRDFDGRQLIKPRKAIKVMCSEIQWGHVAAVMALESARFDPSAVNPDRMAVVYGAETFQTEPDEARMAVAHCTTEGRFDFASWGEMAMRDIQPLWMLKYLPNMVASHISIAFGATGPNNTICQGDVSSMLAVIESATLIQRGWADAAVAGGSGSRTQWHCQAGRRMEDLSRDWDSPGTASRPFHPQRNGYVAGEGAAAVLLESAASALARGAPVLGRLAGWANGFCPPSATEADLVDGIEYVIRLALERSGLGAADVAMVSANGLGTAREDRCEAAALARCLPGVAVFALKSLGGNIGAANGAHELVATLIALEEQVVPATANTVGLSGDAPVATVAAASPVRGSAAVLVGLAPAGQIAALVIQRRPSA